MIPSYNEDNDTRCHAESSFENIKLCLRFLSFLNTVVTLVVELRLSCSVKTMVTNGLATQVPPFTNMV